MSFKDKLDLKEKAKEASSSLGYWFRKKYKLSPRDPRYLSCEPWEIELEFEIAKLESERSKLYPITCTECGEPYYGNECKSCGHKSKTERYFDPDFDEYFDKVEEENEKYFKTPIKWEEVKDDDIGGIGVA